MSVKLNIEYEQLLELAKQLPLKQKEQFILDLQENENTKDAICEKKETKDWQEILRDFPVATEEELDNYDKIRKELNQWGNPK